MTETTHQQDIRMAAWSMNSTPEAFQVYFDEIAAEVREKTGVEITEADIRLEFLGAYHAVNTTLRPTLCRWYIEHLLPDIKGKNSP